jgi:antitoxin CptB
VTAPPAAAAERELRRLEWRCRRGMQELDVVLGRFARQALPGASVQERRLFERLLSLPDPLLAEYLLGGVPPEEPEFRGLTGQIRDLCRRRGSGAVF